MGRLILNCMIFKNIKKVGIIGGLGPKTGFVFAENLNNRFSNVNFIQPDILLLNLPVPEEIMKTKQK